MKLLIISRDEIPGDDVHWPYELMSPDSPQGQRVAQLYGATQYPACIVARSDGALVQLLQGKMPTSAELSYHMNGSI